MSMPVPKARKSRKDSHYSGEEMRVISKYKQEYREQTTRELRGHVFKAKILVDLFNLWLEQGKTPDTEEDSANRMKELAAWVRNNWRPLSTTLETKAHLKVTAINVVWETEKEAVEAELSEILGVDHPDPRHPGYFQQRNAAAKRVLTKMTEQERSKLNSIVEERKTHGHPDHIRRERAERYREKVMRTWSKERWLDMGMATIIFTVHTDRQGRLVADVHDEVLANVELTGKRFTVKHKDQVIEMTRTFLDYMKSLRLQAPEAINPVRITNTNADADANSESNTLSNEIPLDIKMTPEGYPILPIVIMDTEVSKSACESLMRAYLTQHYYLATGKKNRRVPYGALKEDTRAFVTEGSVPAGFIIKEPRSMHRDQIQSVLGHWCKRQEESGPESAFGFQLVMGRKKKRLFADYPPKVAENRGAPKTKNKGKQKEVRQLNGLLSISPNGTPSPSRSPIPGPSRELAKINYTMPNRSTPTSGVVLKLGHGKWQGQDDPGHSRPDDLVRIDMGQMVMLKNMGYQVVGPVNGPNEGLPQYEVPRLWVEQLQNKSQTEAQPDPIPSMTQPYPRPRPLTEKTAPDTTPIDPALLDYTPTEPTSHTERSQHAEDNVTPNPNDDSGVQSGPGPIKDTIVSGPVLGKRNPVVRSPPHQAQSRSTQRRKVITRDDLALQEAQELLKGGIGKRARKKK